MFQGLRNYFNERRRGLATTAGVVGACYLVGKYVADRLEEMREVVVQTQRARENLRRRFEQNQDDISFTIMTLLPTLSKRVLEEMDVEVVTRDLQTQTQQAKTRRREPEQLPATAQSISSLTSSVELLHRPDHEQHDSQHLRHSAQLSDVISLSGTSVGGTDNGTQERHEPHPDSPLTDNTHYTSSPSISSQAPSWVQGYDSQQLGSSSHELSMPSSHHDPHYLLPHHSGQHQQHLQPDVSHGSPRSTTGAYLSDSFLSESMASTSASVSVSELGPVDVQSPVTGNPETPRLSAAAGGQSRSKAELWQEIKILSITRALTIIYSTALLSLFSHVQLNILGRARYVQSVVQLARDEKMRERAAEEESIASLFFSPSSEYGGVDPEVWLDEDNLEVSVIDVETERRYLTLSWWLLHVGWKDIGERVRKSVEDVFEDVSLKSKLGPMELHRHICDVRRRVEHEVTYEGFERRINFLSALIPPTPETLQRVLVQGGAGVSLTDATPSSVNHAPLRNAAGSGAIEIVATGAHEVSRTTLNSIADPSFARLLSETRSRILSQTFALALSACLDRSTELLFESLKRGVFAPPAQDSGVAEESEDKRVLDSRARLEPEYEKVRLASLLPVLARWSREALEGVPNELVDSMAELKEVVAFSAMIFGDFDNNLR